jgi:hypothetical protein
MKMASGFGGHVQHLVAMAHSQFQHALAFVGNEVSDTIEQWRPA